MLNANDKCPCSNWENLRLLIQMQLSEKSKIFHSHFLAFLESALDCKHYEIKKKKEIIK